MPSETIELRGHIIDSLILPKVLDEILTRGGSFKIAEIKIGEKRADQSYTKIEVSAGKDALSEIMLRLRQHGAEVVEKADVKLAAAPVDGVFPDGFYVTTNQPTFVRLQGTEIEASPAIMDCGIAVERGGEARYGREIPRSESRDANRDRPKRRAGGADGLVNFATGRFRVRH